MLTVSVAAANRQHRLRGCNPRANLPYCIRGRANDHGETGRESDMKTLKGWIKELAALAEAKAAEIQEVG